jgi:hypothetical protein
MLDEAKNNEKPMQTNINANSKVQESSTTETKALGELQKNTTPESGAKKKTNRKKISFKMLIMVISLVNVLVFASIFLILNGTKQKAQELKSLRNASAGAEQRSKVEIADLEIKSNIEKSDFLGTLFPDDSGLIEFVKEIEVLKTQGTVKEFSFANENSVRDKTQADGIPFILRMVGTWEEIDRDLIRLQEVPFLQRAVTLDIRVIGENRDSVDFRYGGFLYVDESLKKN